ncbi:hypothetical protein BMH32_08300 [Leucobacter sp. OLJS4]|nr:hypothetical protein BMH27_00050 [Leucobacter sp. OLAS13]PIJ10738.1 hypothetical protein BMH32_08300 [Leucobacter sp. OLJS4]
MKARQSRYVETHARILQAAGKLIAARGYRGVTYDNIAEASGRGVGTVLRHFGTKADLARELVFEQRRRFRSITSRLETQPGHQAVGSSLGEVCFKLARQLEIDPVVQGGLHLLVESPGEISLPAGWPFGEWKAYIYRELLRQTDCSPVQARDRASLLVAFLVGVLSSLERGHCADRVRNGISYILPNLEAQSNPSRTNAAGDLLPSAGHRYEHPVHSRAYP